MTKDLQVVSVKRKDRARRRKKASRTRVRVKSVSQLKKEADRLFSLFIRGKYPKECYTCHAKGKTLQCGHFGSRYYLSIRWDEDNARPQCVGCNIWGRGKPLEFEERLVQEIGIARVQRVKDKRKELVKMTRPFLENLIAELKQKLVVLDNQ